ncbi:hypothetical protein F5888DRAFT_1775756 [Russula emetica]|nr:hypothetical protein F5888DRAFT_1775756 [Russula emetica]
MWLTIAIPFWLTVVSQYPSRQLYQIRIFQAPSPSGKMLPCLAPPPYCTSWASFPFFLQYRMRMMSNMFETGSAKLALRLR